MTVYSYWRQVIWKRFGLQKQQGQSAQYLCEHQCYNYYLDILVCVFDSEIVFLHFLLWWH